MQSKSLYWLPQLKGPPTALGNCIQWAVREDLLDPTKLPKYTVLIC